ncbi:acylphosphatase [Acinetobacter shaoyimingii]|uniref:acylphosphatase n=1 Tax=Acinetobacter shaoyimingii TaxID=2715164 RepID=A0A6G8RWM1_9GAMM|nr:acylphosphatase [Acinetobacter shaoyimingii]NHB57270.1 acylphosphatase [Acinetobacter shaoyimingii]QIO06123.1 acylphosphatase [Acinetobacter shaoyimingii]
MQALKLTISGIVQGVGYRRWFEKQANDLNLKGYVKNLETGDVEAVVIGDEQAIQDILKCSLIGPLRSKVSKIQQEKLHENELQYDDFVMIR